MSIISCKTLKGFKVTISTQQKKIVGFFWRKIIIISHVCLSFRIWNAYICGCECVCPCVFNAYICGRTQIADLKRWKREHFKIHKWRIGDPTFSSAKIGVNFMHIFISQSLVVTAETHTLTFDSHKGLKVWLLPYFFNAVLRPTIRLFYSIF